MKRLNLAKNEATNRGADVIPAAQHNSSYYFKAAMPYYRHGMQAPPADEYERTLADEAKRIIYHADSEIHEGDPLAAAGMLRDAARLMDLWEQRKRARWDAAEARKAQRKPRGKAARS